MSCAAWRARCASAPRSWCASTTAPWCRGCAITTAGVEARGGADGVVLHSSVATHGRDLTTFAGFDVSEGSEESFALAWFPSHEVPPRAPDVAAALEATTRWWHDWVGQCTAVGPVARRRGAVAAHAEGPELRAHRRHRRGRHHVAAGVDRQRPQLGLPLLLAARRHLHPERPAGERLPRRGVGVERVAPPRGGGQPRQAPDHVRRGRGAPPRRVRDPVARRLRGLGAGARRQRRQRAVPARRLRRGAGHDVPHRRGARGPAAPRQLGPVPDARGARGQGLAAPRRRHLGGAGPASGTSCTRR